MTPRQFDSYSNGLLVGRKTRAKTAGIAMFFKKLSVATYVPNSIGCVPFSFRETKALGTFLPITTIQGGDQGRIGFKSEIESRP